jgi:hypothetical protein
MLTPYSEVIEKFIYVFYYPKVSQKIMKPFLIEDFLHLQPVSMTLVVVHLELQISPRIFETDS